MTPLRYIIAVMIGVFITRAYDRWRSWRRGKPLRALMKALDTIPVDDEEPEWEPDDFVKLSEAISGDNEDDT